MNELEGLELDNEFREIWLELKRQLSQQPQNPALECKCAAWQTQLSCYPAPERRLRNELAHDLLHKVTSGMLTALYKVRESDGPDAPAHYAPRTKDGDGDSQWCDESDAGEDLMPPTSEESTSSMEHDKDILRFKNLLEESYKRSSFDMDKPRQRSTVGAPPARGSGDEVAGLKVISTLSGGHDSYLVEPCAARKHVSTLSGHEAYAGVTPRKEPSSVARSPESYVVVTPRKEPSPVARGLESYPGVPLTPRKESSSVARGLESYPGVPLTPRKEPSSVARGVEINAGVPLVPRKDTSVVTGGHDRYPEVPLVPSKYTSTSSSGHDTYDEEQYLDARDHSEGNENSAQNLEAPVSSPMCVNCMEKDHFYEEVISQQQATIERYQRTCKDVTGANTLTPVQQRQVFSDHMSRMQLSVKDLQSKNDLLNEELLELKSSTTNVAVDSMISKLVVLLKKIAELKSKNRVMAIDHQKALESQQRASSNKLEEVTQHLQHAQAKNKRLLDHLSQRGPDEVAWFQEAETCRKTKLELENKLASEGLAINNLKKELSELRLVREEETERHDKVVAKLQQKLAREMEEAKVAMEDLTATVAHSVKEAEKCQKNVADLQEKIKDDMTRAEQKEKEFNAKISQSFEEVKRYQKMIEDLEERHDIEMDGFRTNVKEQYSCQLMQSYEETEKFRKLLVESEKKLSLEILETERLKDLVADLLEERLEETKKYEETIAEVQKHASDMELAVRMKDDMAKQLNEQAEEIETLRQWMVDLELKHADELEAERKRGKARTEEHKDMMKQRKEKTANEMRDMRRREEELTLKLLSREDMIAKMNIFFNECCTAIETKINGAIVQMRDVALKREERLKKKCADLEAILDNYQASRSGRIQETVEDQTGYVASRYAEAKVTQGDKIRAPRPGLPVYQTSRIQENVEAGDQVIRPGLPVYQIYQASCSGRSQATVMADDIEASRYGQVKETVKEARLKEEMGKPVEIRTKLTAEDAGLDKMKRELKDEIMDEMTFVLKDYAFSRDTWLDAYEKKVQSLVIEKDLELEKLKKELMTQTSEFMLTMTAQRQAELEHLVATYDAHAVGHHCKENREHEART